MSNHADFKVKHGLVVNTTASFLSTVTSTSTTTGGVIVSGGVGIAKDVYVGGILNIVNSTSATNTTSGALQVVGGAGFQGDIYARNIYSNGQLVGISSTTATNLANGSAYSIPYQSSPGITTFINPPPSGSTLLEYISGTGFTWTNITSVGGGGAPNLTIEGQSQVLTTVTTLINFIGGGVSSIVNPNSSTEVTISIAGAGFPTGDYGTGEPYASNSGTTDAFGVSLLYIYDCMDPSGYYSYADLGALT